MTAQTTNETPLYENDCTVCVFLGRFYGKKDGGRGWYDLYWCTNAIEDATVLAVRSSCLGDYSEGLPAAWRVEEEGYPLVEARKRAAARGLNVLAKKYDPNVRPPQTYDTLLLDGAEEVTFLGYHDDSYEEALRGVVIMCRGETGYGHAVPTASITRLNGSTIDWEEWQKARDEYIDSLG